MIESLPIEGSNVEFTDYSSFPHVLLVVDQFPKTLGGGERATLNLAENLPKYGFHASMLTFFVHPDCTALAHLPCPIYILPLKRTYGLSAIRAAAALKRFLRSQNVQLVQTFFESSDLWAGFVVKATSGAKLVWSRRDMGILRERKHRIAYRLMSRLPDAVFAVSERVRRYCIEEDGISPTRVETVYNGINLKEWQDNRSRARDASETVVATVGNIRRVKGHDLLIRAAAMIAPSFPRVSFRVAGEVLEPDYLAELQALIGKLELGDRFHLVGPIRDRAAFLADVDVFVLPSRSEGFSNAILEAMAAGLPVVATDVGGNAEAVEDGVNGILVPTEDASALASGITSILADPPRARAMGSAGRTAIAKKFSTDAMMAQIAESYRKLLVGQ